MDIERESIFILISAGKYLRMYLVGVKKSSYHIIAYIQMGIGRASICLLKIWCTPQPKVWCTPQPKVSKNPEYVSLTWKFCLEHSHYLVKI